MPSFLQPQGWQVTGFDISDAGVRLAREAAQKRGLKLEALVEDVDRFDYGKQRWDLAQLPRCPGGSRHVTP